jgi:hypothetical protein
MPKKSKKFAGAAAAILSVIVFASTALAASNNVSGYEKVRESVFKYIDVANNGNYTLETSASILDKDGAELVSLSCYAATQDPDNRRSSASINMDGETFFTENSYNDGIQITGGNLRDSEPIYHKYGSHYDSFSFPRSDGDAISLTDNQKRLVRVLFDLLVGDAKNYCTYSDGDITLRLERGQIPEIAQAALAVMSEEATKLVSSGHDVVFGSNQPTDDIIMSILKDTTIDFVSANGVIDDSGMLASIDTTVAISGSDMNGNPNKLTINATFSISDVGTTVAEPINLEGKNVIDSNDSSSYVDDLYQQYLDGELELPPDVLEYID